MKKSFGEIIDRVKEDYNIVDYIQQNGIALEPSGNGIYKGKCPFHNEKTSSFAVYESTNRYHCFGCKASGDIIEFAQHTHTIDFYDAVTLLGEGIGLRVDRGNQASKPSYDKDAISLIINEAANFFRDNFRKLDSGSELKRELLSKRININGELLGYMPVDGDVMLFDLLTLKGFKEEDIKASGLLTREYDFSTPKLVLTIKNYIGINVSFILRDVDENSKYMWLSDSPVYSSSNIVFGADTAKKVARAQEDIYVVGNPLMQIELFDKGIENVVFIDGLVNEGEGKILNRMIGDSGYISFIENRGYNMNRLISMFMNVSNVKDFHIKSKVSIINNGEIKDINSMSNYVLEKTLDSVGGEITLDNRTEYLRRSIKCLKNVEKGSFIVNKLLRDIAIVSGADLDYVSTSYSKSIGEIVEDVRVKDLKVNVEIERNPDYVMINALTMLTQLPGELIKYTPSKINDKVKGFIIAFIEDYESTINNGEVWTFDNDYGYPGIMKAINERSNNVIISPDMEDNVNHYKFLFKTANELYEAEIESIKMARLQKTLMNTIDPYVIAEALKLAGY